MSIINIYCLNATCSPGYHHISKRLAKGALGTVTSCWENIRTIMNIIQKYEVVMAQIWLRLKEYKNSLYKLYFFLLIFFTLKPTLTSPPKKIFYLLQ